MLRLFDKGVFESDDDDNDDFDITDEDAGESSALSLISSLYQLFKSLFTNSQEVIRRIAATPNFVTFLEKYTRKTAIDAVDDVVPIWEMAMKCIIKTPIPKPFWQMFPRVLADERDVSVHRAAFPIIALYVRDAGFLSSEIDDLSCNMTRQQLLLRMIQRTAAMDREVVDEWSTAGVNAQTACYAAGIVVDCMTAPTGDAIVEQLLQIVRPFLTHAEECVRIASCSVFASAIRYNPKVALTQFGNVELGLKAVFESFGVMKMRHDQRNAIFSVCRLLQEGQLEKPVVEGLFAVLKQMRDCTQKDQDGGSDFGGGYPKGCADQNGRVDMSALHQMFEKSFNGLFLEIHLNFEIRNSMQMFKM